MRAREPGPGRLPVDHDRSVGEDEQREVRPARHLRHVDHGPAGRGHRRRSEHLIAVRRPGSTTRTRWRRPSVATTASDVGSSCVAEPRRRDRPDRARRRRTRDRARCRGRRRPAARRTRRRSRRRSAPTTAPSSSTRCRRRHPREVGRHHRGRGQDQRGPARPRPPRRARTRPSPARPAAPGLASTMRSWRPEPDDPDREPPRRRELAAEAQPESRAGRRCRRGTATARRSTRPRRTETCVATVSTRWIDVVDRHRHAREARDHDALEPAGRAPAGVGDRLDVDDGVVRERVEQREPELGALRGGAGREARLGRGLARARAHGGVAGARPACARPRRARRSSRRRRPGRRSARGRPRAPAPRGRARPCTAGRPAATSDPPSTVTDRRQRAAVDVADRELLVGAPTRVRGALGAVPGGARAGARRGAAPVATGGGDLGRRRVGRRSRRPRAPRRRRPRRRCGVRLLTATTSADSAASVAGRADRRAAAAADRAGAGRAAGSGGRASPTITSSARAPASATTDR